MSEQLNCHTCYKKYHKKPSAALRSKYCSRSCQAKSSIGIRKLVSKKCLGCENIISGAPSKIKDRKYCSVKCACKFNPQLISKTGKNHNRYISGIGTYRKEALSHYEKSCIKCGHTKKVIVHHIDENRKNNNLSNLMILCESCHVKIHKPPVIKKCNRCNVTIKDSRNGHIKYCSRYCLYYRNYPNKDFSKTKNCHECKTQMPKSAKIKQMFCSRTCSVKNTWPNLSRP